MDAEAAPELRIVRGTPTDEELAALVGVLVIGARRADGVDARVPRSRWRSSGRPSAGWPVGPDAWRSAGYRSPV